MEILTRVEKVLSVLWHLIASIYSSVSVYVCEGVGVVEGAPWTSWTRSSPPDKLIPEDARLFDPVRLSSLSSRQIERSVGTSPPESD